jgi:hypothetical protein
MRPVVHEEGMQADAHCVTLVLVGYVEKMGIEEEAVPFREVANSHVLAAISTDDDGEMPQVVVFHWTWKVALESPQDNASKHRPEAE